MTLLPRIMFMYLALWLQKRNICVDKLAAQKSPWGAYHEYPEARRLNG